MDRLTNTATISPKKQLFMITWPIFIESFLQVMMRFSDTFMLSFISDDAVASIGVVNQIMMFTFVLFNFTAMGSGVVVSQFVGANNPEGVRKTIAHAITVNLTFGVTISLLVLLLKDWFLTFFDLGPDLLTYANTYITIVGLFLFAQAMILTMSAILQAMGHTKDVMFVVMGMNIMNVFGNYVFIFGALGFPQLGVQGVALATASMRFIAMIVLFLLLVKRMPIKLPFKAFLNLEKEYMAKILQIGVPAAGEQLSYNTSQIVITMFITSLGATALATRVYAQNLMSFMVLFPMAISKGMQIFIGQLVGAGKDEEAYHNMFIGVRYGLTIAVTIGGFLALFGEQIMGIFTSEADVVTLGATILLIGLFVEPGRTSNIIIISALRASGDAKFPVMMGILFMWGLAVPMSYFLGIHLGFGLVGIWIAMLMDEWIRAGIMWWRWRSKRWMGRAVVERGPDIVEELEG